MAYIFEVYYKNMLHFAKSDTTKTGNNYFYKLKYISDKNMNISRKFYQHWLKTVLLGNIDLHYKIWPSEFQARTIFVFYYNNKEKDKYLRLMGHQESDPLKPGNPCKNGI